MDVLNTINLMPIAEIGITFIAALLGVALTALSRWIKTKTGVEIDLKHNSMINEAIDRGITFAMTRLKDKAEIATSSALVATAAGYVVSGVPKALAHFEITPERLAAMIEARLFFTEPDGVTAPEPVA
jgi:DNA-binding transcriptional regulator YdaS (Cro superfamily)